MAGNTVVRTLRSPDRSVAVAMEMSRLLDERTLHLLPTDASALEYH